MSAGGAGFSKKQVGFEPEAADLEPEVDAPASEPEAPVEAPDAGDDGADLAPAFPAGAALEGALRFGGLAAAAPAIGEAAPFVPGPGEVAGRFAADPAGRERRAAEILRGYGEEIRPGHVYVVQVDQDYPDRGAGTSAIDRGYLRCYTGELSVFRGREDGTLVRVRCGVERRSTRWRNVRGKYHYVPSEGQPIVDRDLNNDGVISGAEREEGGADGWEVTGLNIHRGNEADLSSAGCQNIRRRGLRPRIADRARRTRRGRGRLALRLAVRGHARLHGVGPRDVPARAGGDVARPGGRGRGRAR